MSLKLSRLKLPAKICVGAAVAYASVGIAFAGTQIAETGSSLLYPLFNLWVPVYTKHHPDVKIDTASTGSGTGIAQSTQGLVQIGASDAYMSNALMKKYPTMLNIPVAISSQMVNYNVPGFNGRHLNLSGSVIAKIYQGKIRYWNNAQIRKLNHNAHLPHLAIVAIHRDDGSGDTFIFTQFLSKSAPDWGKDNYGTTISWPKAAAQIGAVGNPGMVTALGNTKGGIAYIGVSYKNQTNKARLGEARLENKSGHFVLPNETTVPAAAAMMVPMTPSDERISLIYAPGRHSYPIINYEYALVNQHQPDAKTAAALKHFLTWAVARDGGNSMRFLSKVHFMPLPAKARKLTLKQIDKIKG